MFDIAHILKSSLSTNSCRQCDEKDATPSETGFVWIEEERNKSPNLQNKDSGCFQCFKGRMSSKAWFQTHSKMTSAKLPRFLCSQVSSEQSEGRKELGHSHFV
jgi:hypothetical protein